MNSGEIFIGILAAICMAVALANASGIVTEKPCQDVRRFEIGNAMAGASGTYCCDRINCEKRKEHDKK